MKKNILFNEKMQKLVIVLQEAARANKDGKRFIEPSVGVWDDTKSKRHHLIFGRRGSGKSSLLRKVENETGSDFLNIYINVEIINENEYPDILIHSLIILFKKLLESLKINKINFLFLPFSKKRKLIKTLKLIINQLEILLHSQDNSQLEIRYKKMNKTSGGVSLGLDFSSAKSSANISETQENEYEEKEIFKRNKHQILHRNLFRIREVITQFAKCNNKDLFLLIDDLYHIEKKDQALYLGFLHKIA